MRAMAVDRDEGVGTVKRAERRLIAVLSGLALTAAAGISWAQDEPASNFAKLSYSAACDSQNNRLLLTNSHTFKTLQTKVRWRAAGGKDLEDQFFPAPSTTIEIGCAADAEIVEVKFADF
jgi:hypothetical protein